MSSGVIIIGTLLSGSAGLVGLLPQGASDIHVPEAPLDARLPYLVVEQISRVERPTLWRGEPALQVTYRIQVTAITGDYAAVQALLAATRSACRDINGATVAGIAGVCTYVDIEGSDEPDAQAGLHGKSQDFIVRCREPRS